MSTRTRLQCLALPLVLLLPAMAHGQGLIWSLPEQEGTLVRYEGVYKQIEFRERTAADDSENREFEWRRVVTIKSLVTPEKDKTGKYLGQDVSCRWIELKVETGDRDVAVSPSGVNPGLSGKRIYKVLIPESRIFGSIVDGRSVDRIGIPVSFIPIVRGYRKIGVKLPTSMIKTRVLQIYPAISLLKHYKEYSQTTESEAFQVPLENQPMVTGIRLKGQQMVQSRRNKFEHTAELLRSDEVPFGLPGWDVKIVHFRKRESDARDQFTKRTETTVRMRVAKIDSEAKSDIAEN